MPPRPRIDGVDLPSHRVGRPRQHSERRATQSISGPLFKGRPRHLLPDSFYVVGDAANATRKRVVTLCVAGVVCVCVCSVCALVLLTYILLTFSKDSWIFLKVWIFFSPLLQSTSLQLDGHLRPRRLAVYSELSMPAPHLTLISLTLISLPVEVLMLVAGCLDARCLASFAGALSSTS